MSIRRRLIPVFRSYLSARKALGFEPSTHVFVLSHMRSGSSLTLNLIATTGEVRSIGELHQTYRSSADLFEMVVRVCSQERQWRPNFRYVADKVLHDRDEIHEPVLRHPGCRWVFLLREPISAIESMCQTFPDWWSERQLSCQQVLNRASEYYVGRLKTLLKYARTVNDPSRCIYFTYNELIDNTSMVFGLVEKRLQLAKPLTTSYQPIPGAKIDGRGDTSWKTSYGSILREGRSFAEKETAGHLAGLVRPGVVDAYWYTDYELRRLCRNIRS